MKLPDLFQSFLHKKSDTNLVYLSLYLDIHQVIVSFWRIGKAGKVEQIDHTHQHVPVDAWKDRIRAVDALLGTLEAKTGLSDINTTILGLSTSFLTSTGEIRKDVRGEIKQLAAELDLKLTGFVPLYQAIIYKLKQDEGVPPSVILLGINGKSIAVSLYKIGTLVGVREIEKHDDIAGSVETALKSFSEMEVLPARILLYGSNSKDVEEAKTKLLHHSWTTKASFLHFPKIDTVSPDMIIDSISLAGASEISSPGSQDGNKDDFASEEVSLDENTAQSEAFIQKPVKEAEDLTQEPGEDEETIEAEADETGLLEQAESDTEQDPTREEVAEAQEILEEDFAVDQSPEEDANIVMVDAQSLGFKKGVDVQEEKKDEDSHAVTSATTASKPHATFLGILSILSKTFSRSIRTLSHTGGRKKTYVGIGLVVLAGIALLGILYWVLPHAVVTVYILPQTLSASDSVTIDSTATVVDSEEKVIPGKSREQSVSGEKTIPVNGKKNVGEPARGSVTIYNKAPALRTFKKGSVLSSGSLKFILDTDVQVASASESVGSITFGKAESQIAASAIGGQSNLPSGSEFTFSDIASSVAIARNDAPLTGGTSREVTVVSRSDYDAFIKEVSTDLTKQAQEQLATSVGGAEVLIDETIKTTVTEKIFDQEIDEEAKELHGKLTVTVSGVAFSKDDIRSLFLSGELDLPQGYTLGDKDAMVSFENLQVKKDGSIAAKATVSVDALPVVDINEILKSLAGKSVNEAQAYLRTIPGISGLKVGFRFNPVKNRLPLNRKNISVTLSTVQ